MKVLHLNTYKSGGAYRAARRIHEAVTKQGVDSSMLFLHGDTEEESIAWHWQDKLKTKIFCRMNNYRTAVYSPERYFSCDLSGFDISKTPGIMNADVVHLHFISDGMFSIKSLKKITALNKPVVWTLHDMCPFTGGCHYSEECNKYENECVDCPFLQKNGKGDLSRSVLQVKKDAYRDMQLFPVGISQWMTECAKNSSVLNHFRSITINNPLDTSVFNIIDRETARTLLGLPMNKKIILFGAESAESDRRKGFIELCAALKELDKDKYICAVFGNDRDIAESSGIKTISLGYRSDDFHLKCLYNAADAFVCPSLYEGLGMTAMEALSCGTPVTAFDVGGLRDMIDHRVNGYLAKPYDTKDLAEGIRFCASSDLRKQARESVVNRFSYEIIGERYKALYEEIK